MREREEVRGGKKVHVVEPEQVAEEQARAALDARIAALEAQMDKVSPGWRKARGG